jgi:hypothetical protein
VAYFPLLAILVKGIHAVLAFLTEKEALLLTTGLLTLACSILIPFLGNKIWRESPHPEILGFKRESWILLALVSVFPHHFFFLTGYSESLFLLLFVAGIYFLWDSRLIPAALCLSLTAVTRPQGIWILGIVGAFLVFELWKRRIRIRDGIPALAILPLPFLAFLYWNWSATGNAFHFLSLQKNWGRSLDIGGGLLLHLPRYDDSRFLLYASLALGLFTMKNKREPRLLLLAALTLLFAEVPVFYGGFYSYPRLMSVSLGLFVLASDFFSTRILWLLAWLLWSVTRLGIQALTYSVGGWAG